MPDYPAGTIIVCGIATEIFTDDDGRWVAYPDGARVEAGTRDDLKTALGRQLRPAAAQVAVPFMILVSPACRGQDVTIRRGTGTGLHRRTGNVLVTWEDGEKGQISDLGAAEKCLDAGTDPAEWLRLVHEHARVSRELRAFEQARRIDVRAGVRDALKAGLGQGNSEDGDRP